MVGVIRVEDTGTIIATAMLAEDMGAAVVVILDTLPIKEAEDINERALETVAKKAGSSRLVREELVFFVSFG